jgi:hypothetical protein
MKDKYFIHLLPVTTGLKRRIQQMLKGLSDPLAVGRGWGNFKPCQKYITEHKLQAAFQRNLTLYLRNGWRRALKLDVFRR